MLKKKLYLYRVLSNDHQKDPHRNNNEGIFYSDQWHLLGLDRQIWRGEKIRSIEKQYVLKPFEVRQSNFDLLISNAPFLGIKLLSLNFDDDLSDDEHESLKYFLRNERIQELLDFVEEQRYEAGKDIEEVTFSFKSIKQYHLVSFSRDGVLTLELSNEEFSDVMSTIPVGVLSGAYIPHYYEGGEPERGH